ncbi:penicillin acylase family protein [Pseudomonas sp. GCM10022188]|uniref:penicillin acylase family protein n=1 Tax=Pseudomonas TaxID=286 RepID=UPI00361C76A5
MAASSSPIRAPRRHWRRVLAALAGVLLLGIAALAAYLHGKQPQRAGELHLAGLAAPVEVRFDAQGVPHIRAENEADLYRALGYLHAQERLFQMEMLRRLARGELAEILGAGLVDTDRLFRTLRLRERASAQVAQADHASPAWHALEAYLDGINQYQASRPLPLEFDLLGIRPRPFSAEDSFSVIGYMAYSFAAALRTEPVLTHIRDQLGADYLAVFGRGAPPSPASPALAAADWRGLHALARLGDEAPGRGGLSQFEGSNAWAIAGAHTASGKPLLAGDPHIRFSVPQVWYSAHLSAPGFELYGQHHALIPFALLGHNRDFGWSLTMFQNDDLDLIAERVNPANAEQVWHDGRWVDLESRTERIAVKDAAPVELTLRRAPHGPLVNDALGALAGPTPIALRWLYLEAANPILDAFYRLNRADSLAKGRAAAAGIEAPGLNIVWASARGDIAWWAAGRLLERPAGADPGFVLDGASAEAAAPRLLPFSANPREENPPRGYVLSANQRPAGDAVPGYYNPVDRYRRLRERLDAAGVRWDVDNSQALQLEAGNGFPQRILAPLMDELRAAAGADEQALLGELAAWDGEHRLGSRAAVLFNQLLYQLAREAMADELGEPFFKALLATRAVSDALPRLAADAGAPWWDDRATPARESRAAIVARAWRASLVHLRATLGADPAGWRWGAVHTLTFEHPLGRVAPLDKLFNVGAFAAPGTHEAPNNLAQQFGPAPWPVGYGPSVRRLIDFAAPQRALASSPLGQSGVPFDGHYADQAEAYLAGAYRPMALDEAEIAAQTRGVLWLRP